MIIGRYILQPEVFEHLAAFEKGASMPEPFEALASDIARFQAEHIPGEKLSLDDVEGLCAFARFCDPGGKIWPDRALSIERARDVLGWQPQRSLTQGLEELVNMMDHSAPMERR